MPPSSRFGSKRHFRGSGGFLRVDRFFEKFSLRLDKRFRRHAERAPGPSLVSENIVDDLRSHAAVLHKEGFIHDRTILVIGMTMALLERPGLTTNRGKG